MDYGFKVAVIRVVRLHAGSLREPGYITTGHMLAPWPLRHDLK